MGFQPIQPDSPRGRFRVRRAVVLAAGFGSRMAQVTASIPKPLVRVNGVRIIDTLLGALESAGIGDVTIVRGYRAAQFDELLRTWPHLKFIDNPLYDCANNISSVVAAADLLAGAYVCEADLLLRDPGLVVPFQDRSNYLGAPVAHTDDWCFETDASGRIVKLAVGGDGVHHMYGISYWTPEDGARLARDAKRAMEQPGGRDLYWDEVALRLFANDYDVHVRECAFDAVREIDTFDELVALDPSYEAWR